MILIPVKDDITLDFIVFKKWSDEIMPILEIYAESEAFDSMEVNSYLVHFTPVNQIKNIFSELLFFHYSRNIHSFSHESFDMTEKSIMYASYG